MCMCVYLSMCAYESVSQLISQPACQPASQPACQPANQPITRCHMDAISTNKPVLPGSSHSFVVRSD